MKSLIKKQKQSKACCTTTPVQAQKTEKVAQCCAKVSKAVAGCHD